MYGKQSELVFAPNFSHASSEMPLSSGRPGPGDTITPLGFIAAISATVFSSFLYTTCSHPRSPRYCGEEEMGWGGATGG